MFCLDKNFASSFRTIRPPFGFNGLGELVYRRTYSRPKSDGTMEEWCDTVERVVNGVYNMQKRWIDEHGLGWNADKAQESAKEMYRRIYDMKFLPPGRGLWAMGSELTEQRKLFAALNNCAFVSTADMYDSETQTRQPSKPFVFLMDASMLGVGVGFDTKGAKLSDKAAWVYGFDITKPIVNYVIPDSREGWVESVRLLIDSYMLAGPNLQFDYSQIRPAGRPIVGFGGQASGPEPLAQLHRDIRSVMDRRLATYGPSSLSVTDIVDMMNYIGKCVVAGNVRRTAEIAFGEADDVEFLNLKNYDVNPQRMGHGWTSNNSVMARLGQSYTKIAESIQRNGEPGIAWLHNMQAFSRMNTQQPDWKDRRAKGGNPCLEQTLESFELCCLVETFPSRHESLDDFLRTLKFAYMYAKTVTLGRTQWPETNRVMLRNRRIGCSVSGIAQFLSKYDAESSSSSSSSSGVSVLQHWLEEGYATIQKYDSVYSEWFAIPRSIKTTSVKPSGSVSLLAGCTPGVHFPESRFYLRRVRLAKDSRLIQPLVQAGYRVEPCVGDTAATVVVEIPVDAGQGVRSLSSVSMWEQLSLAALMQQHWADNQVSCTVTFDPVNEAPHIEHALNMFQYRLKGISFLPRVQKGAYPQMPYEAIRESVYRDRVNRLKPVSFQNVVLEATDKQQDRFCDGESCSISR